MDKKAKREQELLDQIDELYKKIEEREIEI